MAPSRRDDRIRLDDAAVHLDTSDGRSIRAPDDAGNLSAAHFNSVALRGAHHGGGERAGVNDGGGFRGAATFRQQMGETKGRS
jgi:hypothetical protein